MVIRITFSQYNYRKIAEIKTRTIWMHSGCNQRWGFYVVVQIFASAFFFFRHLFPLILLTALSASFLVFISDVRHEISSPLRSDWQRFFFCFNDGLWHQIDGNWANVFINYNKLKKNTFSADFVQCLEMRIKMACLYQLHRRLARMYDDTFLFWLGRTSVDVCNN